MSTKFYLNKTLSEINNDFIELYDTTLRDGNQAVEVNFSVNDKLKIARKLSEFGIHYIEGGWPNVTNKAEVEFFKEVKKENLKSKVAVFGMTIKPNSEPDEDENLNLLIEVEPDLITLMGKAWSLHVTKVLNTSFEENLRMISKSITYLKSYGYEVFFDAEHFYDGFKENKDYALKVLKTAIEAGASKLILCDTRGASLPKEVYEITRNVKDEVKAELGIHAHNDRGLATANSLFAFEAGATQIQGTINGLGERCGNADLIEIIGNLELSYGIKTGVILKKLTEVSNYVYEIANVPGDNYQPFVGKFAFTHKGGIHGDAVMKCPESYEAFDPSKVGNKREITVSSQAGLSNLVFKAQEFGFNLNKNSIEAKKILEKIKAMESIGYHFENAEASLALVFARELKVNLNYFNLSSWRAFVLNQNDSISAESIVKLKVGDNIIITAAEGNGPVNAFDIALRKALKKQYPEISKVSLVGYRVKEVDVEKGTASSVQVFIEFKANGERWSTVGVSSNILKASEEALVDGYIYYLYKILGKKPNS
ncbi:MAG: citramalate synthase [Candidatus Bathyarchaeia archaeon]